MQHGLAAVQNSTRSRPAPIEALVKWSNYQESEHRDAEEGALGRWLKGESNSQHRAAWRADVDGGELTLGRPSGSCHAAVSLECFRHLTRELLRPVGDVGQFGEQSLEWFFLVRHGAQ
jgi:hypothetical protein